MPRSIQLTLEPTPKSAAVARAALHRLDLEPDTYADVALLVTELVASAFAGSDEPPEAQVELAVRLEGVARVEVRDPGGVLEGVEEEVDGGTTLRGMLLDRLASRWGVAQARGTSVVWFEIEPGHERGGALGGRSLIR